MYQDCFHIWPDDGSFELKHVAEFLILITIYIYSCVIDWIKFLYNIVGCFLYTTLKMEKLMYEAEFRVLKIFVYYRLTTIKYFTYELCSCIQ